MHVRLGVDAREWSAALQRLSPDRRDVYFGPEFHELHAMRGDGAPHCSIVEDGSAILLIPGLRRAIDSSTALWDLQTCRTGCAGPLANAEADTTFVENAWQAWMSEAARAGAVAALFRLHPLIGNERWLPASARVRDNRSVVVVDLDQGRDHAWRAAESRHRNMVRKARRLGFAVEWNVEREAFARLHRESMSRLDGDPELVFEPPFFAALWNLPCVEVATVRRDGVVLGGAVFVWSERYGHYYLAARRDGIGNHVGNAVIDAGVDRAGERHISSVYLGGGRTTNPDDDLLRFKRSAGTRLAPYRVALVPVNDGAMRKLVEHWTDEVGAAPGWLLGYRQPKPRRHDA